MTLLNNDTLTSGRGGRVELMGFHRCVLAPVISYSKTKQKKNQQQVFNDCIPIHKIIAPGHFHRGQSTMCPNIVAVLSSAVAN